MNNARKQLNAKPFLGIGLAVALAGCASIDPASVTRPSGTQAFSGNRQQLVQEGQRLWNDSSIGNSGLACQSCHVNGAQFRDTLGQPYPHAVNMATSRAGLDSITAEQMVQLCMVIPMEADPLPWDSRELSALSAYVEDVVQPGFANGN